MIRPSLLHWLLVAMVPAGCALAQTQITPNQSTVFQRAFNAATTPQVSAIMPQVGQALHNVTVLFPTATGNVTGFVLRTEASYDNTVWFPIGSDLTSATFTGNLANSSARSNGSYPYIRLRLVTAATLPMTVYYTGSPVPIPVIPNQPTATAFAQAPNLCPPGKSPQGIDASGNAIACGIPKDYIDVQDFGAVGNGVTNDTAAVNAAKAAAAAQGKTRLHFPGTIGGYLLDALSLDGFRLTGEYTRTNFGDGVGSRLIMNPNTTAGNFITMEPAANDNLHQNAVTGLWIDCNHKGTIGLLFTAVNGRVEDSTISNCTNTGLVNDGAQNSLFSNLDLQHNAIGDRVVNGASSNHYDRIEHADSTTVHQRIGLDATLPGQARQAALSVANNYRNTFSNSIYSDGGSFTYALDIDSAVENTWEHNTFTPGTTTGGFVALVHTGNNGYSNRFSDNSYYMGGLDKPVFKNSMPSTYVDAGSFQLVPGCVNHPIVIDGGNMNWSGNIHWNDGCYANVQNNTADPLTWHLWIDDAYRGGQTWQRAGRPTGTVGQTYYDYDLGKLLIWDRTHYVDVYGNDPASPAPTGGTGGTTTTTSSTPTMPKFSVGGIDPHILAYYDMSEVLGAGGTKAHCNMGTACTDLVLSGGGGGWNGMGYAFPSGSTNKFSIPDSLFNAAKTIISIQMTQNQSGYHPIMGCGSWSWLMDQDQFDMQVYNIPGGGVMTNRHAPGVNNSMWAIGQSRALTWVRGSNASTDPERLMIDNAEFAYNRQNLSGAVTNSDGSCYLGYSGDFGAPNNTIYGFMLLDTTLDKTVFAQLIAALKEHQHRKAVLAGIDARDVITFSGNSITAGHTQNGSTAGDAGSAIARLVLPGNGLNNTTILGPWRAGNAAIQGMDTEGMRDTDQAFHQGDNGGSGFIPIYTPSSNYRFEVLHHVCVGWEGTNSIIGSNYTLTRQTTAYAQWAAGRVAEGCEVIMATTLPNQVFLPTSGGTTNPAYNAGKAAIWLAANQDVRTNYRTYGAVGYIDLANAPEFQDPANNASNLWLDGTHLNLAGEAILAAYMRVGLTMAGVH